MIKNSLKLLCFVHVLATSLFAEPKEAYSKTKLSNNYSTHFIRSLQLIFPEEDILSEGGRPSVDVMFQGFDLNGKNILDIGSGFGGVDIYLAEKFTVKLKGVDCEPYMVQQANQYLEKRKHSLLGEVSFQTLEDKVSLREFEDNTFDFVFSKETFYHVPIRAKQQYINEIYRILKPGGTFIIADWYQGTPILGDHLKRAATNSAICQFVTPEAFWIILEGAKFQNITYIDESKPHIQYTIDDIERMHQNASLICQELGESTYQFSLTAWKNWLEAQISGELLSGIFIAIKPE